MRKAPVLLVLAALLAPSTTTEAQFSYSVQDVNQTYQASGSGYMGGFTATFLFENINDYNDPDIISFRAFSLHTSQRVRAFCDLYGMSMHDCSLTGASPTIQGNVQTGTIPVGNSFWAYFPLVSEDSCNTNCFSRNFDFDAAFGVLGCQGPLPTPDFYAGRTCDADGYTGTLAMTATFRYYAPSTNVPVFVFDASDLTATGTNRVWQGPNAFTPMVTATPEPSSWLLMATGLGLVGGVARRRRRQRD